MTWRSMIRRCCDPNNSNFPNYGGRGITVCPEWRNSFGAFAQYMGPKPTVDENGKPAKYSIERIDNDKGYEPGNVIWATAKKQSRNQRSNRLITIDGRTQCVAAWAEERSLSKSTISNRLRLGWTDHDAVMIPVNSIRTYHDGSRGSRRILQRSRRILQRKLQLLGLRFPLRVVSRTQRQATVAISDLLGMPARLLERLVFFPPAALAVVKLVVLPLNFLSGLFRLSVEIGALLFSLFR